MTDDFSSALAPSEGEPLYTITEAARHFPGRKPSAPTMWRWILYGTRGRKLRSLLIGGRRYVPRSAIAEFVIDGSRAAGERRQCDRRQREIQAAEAKADALRL